MMYAKIKNKQYEISRLGLGAMRLPIIDNDYGRIDYEKTKSLISTAINKGINFIDTGYNYHDHESEKIIGKIIKNFDRDKVIISTKSPIWLINEYGDFEKVLNEQLDKLDVEYIDFYLLHGLVKSEWDYMKKIGCLDFFDKMKSKGKIRGTGFSIHDDKEVFKEIIDAYDWDMTIVQMNYMDQFKQVTLDGIRYASNAGVSVGVMEPLKGGLLSYLPSDIQKHFADEFESSVEAAFSWLISQDAVAFVLSGMTTEEQLNQNIEVFSKNIEQTKEQVKKVSYDKVREALEQRTYSGCTSCKYCCECPSSVDISRILTLYDQAFRYDNKNGANYTYNKLILDQNKGYNCVECGYCESKCPQKIDIIKKLKFIDNELRASMSYETFSWSAD